MMGGSYPESDITRASLVQINEISWRAKVVGMLLALRSQKYSWVDSRGGGEDGSNSASRMTVGEGMNI